MSSTPTPAEASSPEPKMSELTARFAYLLAAETIVSDLTKQARAVLSERIFAENKDSGAKTFAARSEDGVTMAEFTLKNTTAAYKVTNPDQFLNFVLENFATEVEVATAVKAAFQKALLSTKRLAVGDEGEVIDTETGLVVAGVEYFPSVASTSFGTSWKGTGKFEATKAVAEGAAVIDLVVEAASQALALEADQ